MKTKEILTLATWSYFQSPLNQLFRIKLKELIKSKGLSNPKILDVGGRKSPYTVGIKAEITVSDIPKESEVQKQLNLGMDDEAFAYYKSNRSNIKSFVFDSMEDTKIEADIFDLVISVEVLEHVEFDDAFIRNVAKVLKRGGTFMMTTPNGDFKPIPHNNDHKRHYKRQQLHDLLAKYFAEVSVGYAIPSSSDRMLTLSSVRGKSPRFLIKSAIAKKRLMKMATDPKYFSQPMGTHHLFAMATKSSS